MILRFDFSGIETNEVKKEFEGIKDANALLSARNQAFASLILSNSFIPNSNKKLLVNDSTH